MEPLIRLHRVSKSYSEGAEVRRVLRETSASFAEGEIVAIRGRSGSGKTTLLNLLAGIDSPSAGEVWVADTCLSRLSPSARTLFRRDHLGFVFQFFNLIPTLRVVENVQLPAELRGASADEASRRARALLAEVGLAGREQSFPDRLSGGSSSASPLPGPWCRTPAWSWPTSPPGTWTTRPARRSWTSSRG